MFLVLSLLIAAGVAMFVAVAQVRRPLVSIPAAGVASGVLLVLAGEFAVAGYLLWSVAAVLPGVLAFGFGAFVALAERDRRQGEEFERERCERLDRYVRHEVFAENVAADEVELFGGAR
ncbi:hypothetical protein [Spirillospora sp. CA-128828]|uniref:hypothetical protein n=1 Tax=Spirillospora sp. CA-128828 TaxID=3240033 RepID=UPI003D8F21BF